MYLRIPLSNQYMSLDGATWIRWFERKNTVPSTHFLMIPSSYFESELAICDLQFHPHIKSQSWRWWGSIMVIQHGYNMEVMVYYHTEYGNILIRPTRSSGSPIIVILFKSRSMLTRSKAALRSRLAIMLFRSSSLEQLFKDLWPTYFYPDLRT